MWKIKSLWWIRKSLLHDEENFKLRDQTFMSSNTDLHQHQDIYGGIAFIYQNFLEGSGLIRVWYSNCKLTDVFWHLIWWIKDMYAPNHFRCNNAQNFKKTAAISLQKNITKGQNHIYYTTHACCIVFVYEITSGLRQNGFSVNSFCLLFFKRQHNC